MQPETKEAVTPSTPRERILDVASRLFYSHGIHAVGIDRVIGESSVAKATLYAHFASKEELVAAYLARESDRWTLEAERRLAQCPPGAGAGAAVSALFEMLYDKSRAPGYRGCPFINAAAEFPDRGPVTEQITVHRDRQRRVFATAIGGDESRLDADRESVFALFNGAMVAAYLERRPEVVMTAKVSALRLLAPSAAPLD